MQASIKARAEREEAKKKKPPTQFAPHLAPAGGGEAFYAPEERCGSVTHDDVRKARRISLAEEAAAVATRRGRELREECERSGRGGARGNASWEEDEDASVWPQYLPSGWKVCDTCRSATPPPSRKLASHPARARRASELLTHTLPHPRPSLSLSLFLSPSPRRMPVLKEWLECPSCDRPVSDSGSHMDSDGDSDEDRPPHAPRRRLGLTPLAENAARCSVRLPPHTLFPSRTPLPNPPIPFTHLPAHEVASG